MTRFVILSFTAALDRLATGKLTEDNLKDAVFCLGCTQEVLETEAEEILEASCDYLREKVTLTEVVKLVKSIKEAELDNRVVWRRTRNGNRIEPSIVHASISSVLVACNLKPLNPNLPPLCMNNFLETAIERANNDSHVLVRSIY